MSTNPLNAADVARRLAARLDQLSIDYAVGGALALGFWGAPRGTLDVDLTLFIPPESVTACVDCLRRLGCDGLTADLPRSLREHGFGQVRFLGTRVDVFLPIIDFYQRARARRQRVQLGDQAIWIWDAESLVVFKMMFFRRKDLADVEQVLDQQGDGLDRTWVRQQLESIYGARDPRLSQWDDLVAQQNRES